jgi:hypothetical protein
MLAAGIQPAADLAAADPAAADPAAARAASIRAISSRAEPAVSSTATLLDGPWSALAKSMFKV